MRDCVVVENVFFDPIISKFQFSIVIVTTEFVHDSNFFLT